MTTVNLHPHSANRWTACSAAPLFKTRAAPQQDNDASREGIAAAWIAEQAILNRVDSTQDLLGQTCFNGWLITQDMCELVQPYVEMVKSRSGNLLAEKSVTLSSDPLIEGPVDSASLAIIGGVLYCDELKYGHRIVEVFENKQLLIYAAALAMKYAADGYPVNQIQLGIYQPRGFHVDGIYRTWVIDLPHLEAWGNWIIERGKLCHLPEPVATPGEHCINCPAATSCEALTHTNYNNIYTVNSKNQRDLTVQELSNELDFLEFAGKVFEARKKAVQTEAKARMNTETIPNWSAQRTRGNRKFTVSGEVINLLFGVDLYEKKLGTPAALERAGVSKEAVKLITTQPDTGAKLTRRDRNLANEIFGEK